MASTAPMVVPVTAPIDIQPAYPSTDLASSCLKSATMESFADSGYESSWPSLSEASAWTPPSALKQQKSGDGNPVRGIGSPGNSPSFHASAQGKVQSQDHGRAQQKRWHKDQQRRAGTKDYQGQRTLQPLNIMPLVDFGSPQMEDDDQHFGPEGPPIPLSVIPRGWLYEDDFVPSLADDVLIALPKREWVYDSSGSVAMDPKSFVVMSWNVLSPRLCHASRLDPGCEPAFLDWNYRKQAILNQIAFMDADIVCLQELELDDYEGYFNPQLTRLGFKSIHAYKTTVYEMRDGCAIFYRESRFKLLHEHVLRFNQVELDDHNTGRPSLARDTAIRFNLFHNLAIVALFENRKTKRQVQVATTHLLADPAFPDAKMLQTAILTSKLEELKAEAIEAATAAAATAAASPQQPRPASAVPPQHIPTILAGDFNSLPDSSVVSFLKTGQVETRHFGGNDFGRFTRAESKYFHHGLGLSDSYESSILPFTNATRKFQGTIDYMLYDPSALGLVGFLDHLEADPMWSQAATASPSSSSSTTTTTSTRSRTHANMSSSDLDSELEIDSISSPPSSVTSCTPSSIDSTATRRKNKASKRAKKVSIRDLSLLLTSQASIQSQDGSKKKTAMAKTESDQELEHDPRVVVRADIPTALPGQHFPSDHLPLVAIFREREHVQTATPKVE